MDDYDNTGTLRTGPLTLQDRYAELSTNDDWEGAEEIDNVEIEDGRAFVGSAIPDSAIHHWPMDEGGGSTISDGVGSINGTLEGSSWVSGSWWEGHALDGDGVDDRVDLSSNLMGPSFLSGEFTILATIETTTTSESAFMANVNDDADQWQQYGINRNTEGGIDWVWRDDSRDEFRVYTENSYNDGTPHRIAWRNPTTNPSHNDVEIFVDASSQDLSTEDTGSVSNHTEWNTVWPLFARVGNENGGYDNFYNGILDNIIICDESLTESEIQHDYNRQPWS